MAPGYTDNTLALKRDTGRVADSSIKLFTPSGLSDEEREFISSFIILNGTTRILRTRTRLDLEKLDDNLENIINLQRINDIRFVNKFFESVNQKLPDNGFFAGCVETYEHRKIRINKKYPKVIAVPFYGLSFISNRVIPKLPATKKLYFNITKGNNRVLSKAETLGRLASCGFEILGYREFNNLLYFACRKIKQPAFDSHPSYGPLFKMKRLGKDGKVINVYKLRTMHPYAEYLQDYIYEKNNLDEGGKFKDDFRITYWGKIFRKFWIDELPMLLNWIKGDLKLVGLRPLSMHYFNLYSDEFKQRRLKHKPGLIPPYYVDMPKGIDEIVASEKKYLDAYEKNPVLTDIKYFFRVFYNIIFKKVRSK